MFTVEILVQIFKTYSHLFYWWATQNVKTDYIHTDESNYNVLYQNITSYISCLHTNLHTACARCCRVLQCYRTYSILFAHPCTYLFKHTQQPMTWRIFIKTTIILPLVSHHTRQSVYTKSKHFYTYNTPRIQTY